MKPASIGCQLNALRSEPRSGSHCFLSVFQLLDIIGDCWIKETPPSTADIVDQLTDHVTETALWLVCSVRRKDKSSTDLADSWIHFSSKWYLHAREYLDVLSVVSRKFPQCRLQNNSNVGLIEESFFHFHERKKNQINLQSVYRYSKQTVHIIL